MAAFALVFSQNPPTNQKITFFYHQKPTSFPKTLFRKPPFKPSKPYICLHCYSPKTLISLSFLIRPTVITITTAALLLSCFAKPSLACPPPNSEPSSQTLALDEIDAETEQSIEELRSLLRDIQNQQHPRSNLRRRPARGARTREFGPPAVESPLLDPIQRYPIGKKKKLLERIISESPFSVEPYHGLVMAHRQAEESLDGVLERVDDVIRMCEKEKRRGDLRDFKLLKAEIKVAVRKYEEGIGVYEELRKKEMTDFSVYLCEGIVYMLMRKKNEAEKQFEKYRRLVLRGHKYAAYFENGMIVMKVLGEMAERRRGEGLKI